MNDVQINNTDPGVRRNSVASSQRNPAPVQQESVPDQSVSQAQEQQKLKEAKLAAESQEQVAQNKETVQEAVTRLNDYVQSVQRDLEFQLDEHSGKTIVTVLDSRTNEVVRQIPDDVALRLAQELQQDEPLSLFNAKV